MAEPTGLLRLFGKELRQAREAVGLTQDELGQKVAYSRGQIGMVENGQRRMRADTVHDLDDILETGGLLYRIWEDAVTERTVLRIADLARVEAQAILIRSYNPMFIPGLLQTEPYIRALFGSALLASQGQAVIDDQVARRLKRQQILSNGTLRRYVVLLDEGAIRRVIGTPDIMAEQLHHVLDAMDRRGVTIQVMPFRAGTYPASGPMTILGLDHEVVSFELPVGGGQTTADEDTVQACNEQFDLLRADALPRAESMRLIEHCSEELEHQ